MEFRGRRLGNSWWELSTDVKTKLHQSWGRALRLILAVTVVGIFGCASTTRVHVKSSQRTNDGNTLYMMVRDATGKPIVSESYQEVATKLFTDPPDESVMRVEPIFPGNTVSFVIEGSDSKDIFIYFFYTDPGDNWRLPLRKPLPAEVFIELGQYQIERVQVRKR